MNLSRINRITHIVTFTIRYMCDQTLRFAKLLADDLYNVDILLLIVSTDIINLTNTTVMDNQINRFAVILHIQPVTHIQTFTIYRQRFVSQRIDDHQRNQFLRKMIRSVVIGTTADRNR